VAWCPGRTPDTARSRDRAHLNPKPLSLSRPRRNRARQHAVHTGGEERPGHGKVTHRGRNVAERGHALQRGRHHATVAPPNTHRTRRSGPDPRTPKFVGFLAFFGYSQNVTFQPAKKKFASRRASAFRPFHGCFPGVAVKDRWGESISRLHPRPRDRVSARRLWLFSHLPSFSPPFCDHSPQADASLRAGARERGPGLRQDDQLRVCHVRDGRGAD
jgi:hypothetical protein